MFLQPSSVALANPPLFFSLQSSPCKYRNPNPPILFYPQLKPCKIRRSLITRYSYGPRSHKIGLWRLVACNVESNNKHNPAINVEILDATKRSTQALSKKVSREAVEADSQEKLKLAGLSIPTSNSFGRKQGIEQKHATFSFSTSVQDDPFVYKLSNQLGSLHGAPIPPFLAFPRTAISLFGFFFLVGVVFDKVWTSRKTNSKQVAEVQNNIRPQVPTNISQFLEQDLQRKESVEWVNMVLGKLWKVYRVGLENWMVGLLQPVVDNLTKPGYVQRVEIKQFFLGEEPISVRSVERRTSRRANDLQ